MRKTVFVTGLLLASVLFLVQRPAAKAEAAKPTTTKPAKVIVEVKKGDSLSKIAKKHKTTYVRMYAANNAIKDPDLIYPGMKLRVPGASEKLKGRGLNEEKSTVTPSNKKTKTTKQRKYTTKTPVKSYSRVATGSVWDRLAACESGGNWAINTGNGYYGGLQFTASTWRAVGGSGLPHQNSRAEQIKRAQILQARSGWGQWPACSARLGLR